MKLRALSFVLVACVGLSLHRSTLAQGIPCRYEVAHVIQAPDGPFGASPTGATAISPNGRYVCGWFNPGGIGYQRAFVFDTQTHEFRILPLPVHGYQSSCRDVNDAGLAVGSYWISDSTQPQRGFVYDIAAALYVTELLPLSGGAWCEATGISPSNMVCGVRSIGSKGDPVNPQTAFIWSDKSGFTDLGLIDGRSTSARAINASGLVSISTGFSSTPGALAYLWSGGAPQYLGPAPGCMTSDIGVINDLGWASVSGMAQPSPLQFRSFLRRDDGFYLLRPPLPGGFSAGALGITNSGLTSGHTNFGFPVQYQRATIWRDGQPIDLNTLLVSPLAGVLEDRACISDNEIIVAGGENDEGEVVAFLLNPIRAPLGDTDCDSQINIDDLLNVIAHWGPCAGCNPDLTRDGAVNIFDLVEVILNWGASGGAP